MFNFFNIEYLTLIAKFIIPFLLGSLLFFTAIVAPTIFKTLDAKNSRLIIRNIFPKLYSWSIIISLLIFVLLTSTFSLNILTILSSIIVVLYIFSRQFLMPKINRFSDKNHKKEFVLFHTISVFIFVLQIIMLAYIYIKI